MTDQKTLLIIDDEISITESLSMFFEDEGYNVFTANDGGTGLDIFFKEEIDVVLTDLRMPVKDGIEVMKAIHETSPDTPMLVFSGAGENKDIIRALRMGAKDYITKPIEDLEMIAHSVFQAFSNKKLQEENKQYRLELKKSEQRYRTITENIAEGVFTVDESENFTYVNQAFSAMTGYSVQELLRKNLKEIVSKESLDALEAQLLTQKKGLTGRFEIQILDKAMKPVHAGIACTPVFTDSTQYLGFISVVHDITALTELRNKFEKFLSQVVVDSEDVVVICASCKNLKNEDNDWIPVEDHFNKIAFSHGICPDCLKKLFHEFDFADLDKKNPSSESS